MVFQNFSKTDQLILFLAHVGDGHGYAVELLVLGVKLQPVRGTEGSLVHVEQRQLHVARAAVLRVVECVLQCRQFSCQCF
jgi:hypothetical protein